MKFSEEVAKAAREEFERGKEFGSGKFRRPPVNTTLAEIYAELMTELSNKRVYECRQRLEAGTRIWENIGFRFALRILCYRIRYKIWYIFSGGGSAG